MAATGEGDGVSLPSRELQARPAPVGGLALVVLHQVGQVREDDRGVGGAAHWDQLEEEATVRLNIAVILPSQEPEAKVLQSKSRTPYAIKNQREAGNVEKTDLMRALGPALTTTD